MKFGDIAIILICGLIGGAFIGWAVATVGGMTDLIAYTTDTQSAGTGIGSLVGLIVCLALVGVLAAKRRT